METDQVFTEEKARLTEVEAITEALMEEAQQIHPTGQVEVKVNGVVIDRTNEHIHYTLILHDLETGTNHTYNMHTSLSALKTHAPGYFI